MAGVLLGVRLTPSYHVPPSRMAWAVQLASLSAIGAGVYLVLCRILGVRTFGR